MNLTKSQIDTLATRYEIRNDLAARQPYARNGNVGGQRPVMVYTVYDRMTGKPVSSPMPRLRDCREFILGMATWLGA